VQAQTYLFPESVLALTRWRFGFHFFGEALWEWLTEFPKTGPLPQMSHVFGMMILSILTEAPRIHIREVLPLPALERRSPKQSRRRVSPDRLIFYSAKGN